MDKKIKQKVAENVNIDGKDSHAFNLFFSTTKRVF